MTVRKVLIALAFAQCFTAHAAAPNKQLRKAGDAAAGDEAPRAVAAAKESRIVRFTYSPDVIYRIATQPYLHTHVELGEDEGIIEEPMIGNRLEWNVSGGPRNIYIKPLFGDVSTSLTLVTNKRVYQLQLLSGNKQTQVYQKVSFDYPEREAAIKLRHSQEAAREAAEQERLASQIVGPDIDPSSLNFDFAITGNADFKPTAAYTDGKFTYLRLPNTQDSPAVMLVDDAGNLSLINYAVKGNLIIVERVAKQLLLKLGAAEVRITQRPAKGKKGTQTNG